MVRQPSARRNRRSQQRASCRNPTCHEQPGAGKMISKSSCLDYAGVASRWILAALFIYMGWTKAMHPEAFLKLIRQYDLTTNSFLLNSIAAALPWFEIYCGVLLIAGVAVRGSALLLLLMLVPFTAVVFRRALAVSDIQHIAFCAVRFDCG